MAEPKVHGGAYDAAERREKLDALQKERQRKFADHLRRNKVDIRVDKTDKDPALLEREYREGRETALERELYAAGARGGVGSDGGTEDV